jgi:hypothetical protein
MTTRKQLNDDLLCLADGQRERIIAQYAAMMEQVREMQHVLQEHCGSLTHTALADEQRRLTAGAERLEMMALSMISVKTQRGAA